MNDACRFRLEGRSRPRAGAYDDVTVVRVGARVDGTGGELVAAVEKNGSVDILTRDAAATDADGYSRRRTIPSAVPQKQNLDWGAGSMAHELQAMAPQQQRRPPAGGRAVPSGAPPEPPPTYGRKRTTGP